MKPAYRKEVPTVKIDRYTNSGVEDEDLTRYHFAKASLLLRELADTASRAFVEGRVFSEVELRQMHQDLNGVWDIVVSETVDCIAPQDGGSADDLEAYHVLYSDGSPVTTVNFAYVIAEGHEAYQDTWFKRNKSTLKEAWTLVICEAFRAGYRRPGRS